MLRNHIFTMFDIQVYISNNNKLSTINTDGDFCIYHMVAHGAEQS